MEARDDFALLGQPRQPFLNTAAIHRVSLELSSEAHPDSPGGDADRFAAIQAARKTLADPAARIRRLIELEKWTPAVLSTARPPHEEWFPKVAEVLNRRESARSTGSPGAERMVLALRLGELTALRAEIAGEIRKLENLIETHGGPGWKSAPVDWKSTAAALASFQKWERSLRDEEFAARRLIAPADEK